jgi:hypothetical protein
LPCAEPVVALERPSPRFRYGCFCGRGHPNLNDERQGKESQVNAEGRRALVEKYLSIKPIDSLDRACQNHDICWTRYGRDELACNDTFIDELEHLRVGWSPNHIPSVVTDLDKSCAYLAEDMKYAFILVGPADSEDEEAHYRHEVSRASKALITIMYAGRSLVAGFLGKNYPKGNQLCIANFEA